MEHILVTDTGLSPVIYIALEAHFRMQFTLEVPPGSAASVHEYESRATQAVCTALNATSRCSVSLSNVTIPGVLTQGDVSVGGTLLHQYNEHLGTYERARGRQLAAQAVPALHNYTQLDDVAAFLAVAFGTPIAWRNRFYSKKYTVYADVLLDVAPSVVAATSLSGASLASSITLANGGCAFCTEPETVYPPSTPPLPPPTAPPHLPLPPSQPHPLHPPPTRPPPGICDLDVIAGSTGVSVCSFSLITLNDAIVASHTHYGAFAIGGSLTDSTPEQHGIVAGHSYIKRSVGQSRFFFPGGVSYGQDLPFDFGRFERLASMLEQSTHTRERVYVVCSGGTYDFSNFCADCPGRDHDAPSGDNILVVFNTAETVVLRGEAIAFQ